MKFLFIVQGEGRGHLTQALTLEEHLLREGHEVVEVLVGKSRNRELPPFFRQAPLSRFESPNFLPTPANRKNNLTGSILYNIVRLPAFSRSILFIRQRIKASGADIVVNFYELLTGLTYLFCPPETRQISFPPQRLSFSSGKPYSTRTSENVHTAYGYRFRPYAGSFFQQDGR